MGVRAIHSTAHDAFPFALELGEFGLVCSKLGTELKALGLFLRDEAKEVGMPVARYKYIAASDRLMQSDRVNAEVGWKDILFCERERRTIRHRTLDYFHSRRG